jgi:hypothetical protein
VKIVTSVFLFLLVFLTVQPLFPAKERDTAFSCAHRMQCPMKKHSKDQNKREAGGCNPFMACTDGNFFVFDPDKKDAPVTVVKREKIPAINDFRLASCPKSCWHPPEHIPGIS